MARVDIASALPCIALGIPDKSLDILFFSHSPPHLIRAVQYFPVLLTTHPIAGAITFDIRGHPIAHVTHPSAVPYPISHNVVSPHLFIIGCVPQNHAQTTQERNARDPSHLDHEIYPPQIGAVKAI